MQRNRCKRPSGQGGGVPALPLGVNLFWGFTLDKASAQEVINIMTVSMQRIINHETERPRSPVTPSASVSTPELGNEQFLSSDIRRCSSTVAFSSPVIPQQSVCARVQSLCLHICSVKQSLHCLSWQYMELFSPVTTKLSMHTQYTHGWKC